MVAWLSVCLILPLCWMSPFLDLEPKTCALRDTYGTVLSHAPWIHHLSVKWHQFFCPWEILIFLVKLSTDNLYYNSINSWNHVSTTIVRLLTCGISSASQITWGYQHETKWGSNKHETWSLEHRFCSNWHRWKIREKYYLSSESGIQFCRSWCYSVSGNQLYY